jgi:hypothetical protein
VHWREGKLSSSKSRERWGNLLGRLIPVFGRLRVDDLWRQRVGPREFAVAY